MAYQGWIKLHRKIQASDIWPEKRFTNFELWIYLMLMANHKDNTLNWDGMSIPIKRGQLVTSIGKLAKYCNGGKDWIRKRLDLFVKKGMIKRESRPHKYTIITICNFNRYNDTEKNNG